MRKTAIALLALGLVVSTSAYAANAIRFSQVYPGGGSSSGTYKYDYVELFNNSGVPVSIGGWSVQYGSATGSFASNSFGIAILPQGATIPACGYYLVQCGSAGSGGADLPVTPDFAYAVGPNLGAASGKVALFTDAVQGRLCAQALIDAQDLVGWGTANCYEGSAAVANLSATTTALRGNGGITDTDQNSADFTIVNASSVTLHNTGSGTNPGCFVPTVRQTWGRLKSIYR